MGNLGECYDHYIVYDMWPLVECYSLLSWLTLALLQMSSASRSPPATRRGRYHWTSWRQLTRLVSLLTVAVGTGIAAPFSNLLA